MAAPRSNQNPNDPGGARNSIRFDRAKLNEFLDDREAARPKNPGATGAARRVYVRLPYRVSAVAAKFVHPGGSESNVIVACRDLSAGGIALLHRTYVHKGTKCVLSLPDNSGEIVHVSGTVVRCTLVQGTVHEVGVSFDTTLRARDFVTLDPFADGFSFEQVSPDELKGTVLYVDDSEMDHALIRHFLRDTQLRLLTAGTRPEVLEKLTEGVDLILCDFHLSNDNGASITEYLRAEGVATPIIILTADTSQATRNLLIRAQANAFLGKPLAARTLYRAIAEFMVVGNTGGAVSSSLPADHPNRVLLGSFVNQIHELGRRLEKAIAEDSFETARALCLQIAGTSPVMGFEKLAAMAIESEKSVSASMSVTESVAPLRRLAEACRRVSERIS